MSRYISLCGYTAQYFDQYSGDQCPVVSTTCVLGERLWARVGQPAALWAPVLHHPPPALPPTHPPTLPPATPPPGSYKRKDGCVSCFVSPSSGGFGPNCNRLTTIGCSENYCYCNPAKINRFSPKTPAELLADPNYRWATGA